jgi:ketosteroid isomerase-like protein
MGKEVTLVGIAEEIHEANKRFQDAIRAADSQTMPSLYTGDAKILPPNAEAVRGADAIAAYWQSFFDLGIAGAQPKTEEVIPMGEYALETGRYSVFGKDGSQLDRGKIMVLWKNEGGAWKMHRDTWNSSVSQPSG